MTTNTGTVILKYIYSFHFKHLKSVKQSYTDHMKDSFFYSLVCLKLGVYFFIHGLYPDILDNTSIELSQLSTLIKSKYNSLKDN
jgi:hypothetical protein